MNVVNEYGEKRNGFVEVVAFCHVTCRYFDRFLLQGVDKNWRQACFVYLAPGLTCEGYWQVNSRKSIFRIADLILVPTLVYHSIYYHGIYQYHFNLPCIFHSTNPSNKWFPLECAYYSIVVIALVYNS